MYKRTTICSNTVQRQITSTQEISPNIELTAERPWQPQVILLVTNVHDKKPQVKVIRNTLFVLITGNKQ